MAKPAAPREPFAPRRVSRWRVAWRVLTGEAVIQDQILQDWLSYRLLFDDLLKRFSALLARQAKADHARLREQLAADDEVTHRAPAPNARSRKDEVRRRVAESRGFSMWRGPAAAAAHDLRPLPIPTLPPELELELPDDEEEDDAP